jgi:predicted nucleic-acid-binding Zn-ribbon protein
MDLEAEYNAKLDDLCNKIPNNKYIFEVTKLCGYGEFLLVYKKQTLLDLYRTVSIQTECKDILELFFIDSTTNKKIKVPITNEITIWEFIFSKNNGPNQVIKPIYPIPCKIVYRLYFDDGHTHGDTACELKVFT